MTTTEQLEDWLPIVREMLSRELPGRADDLPGWQFDDAPLAILGAHHAYLRHAIYASPDDQVIVLAARRDDQPDYVFQYLGLPQPAVGMETLVYPDPRRGPEGPLRALAIRHASVYTRRSVVVGQLVWIPPGIIEDRLLHFTQSPKDRRERDMRAAVKGVELLFDIVRKPGPQRGAVKGTKYKTPEEWRLAIREKVLTKGTRLTATDDTIAHWLGVGKTTMYRLMGRWGPSSLEDLRNGQL